MLIRHVTHEEVRHLSVQEPGTPVLRIPTKSSFKVSPTPQRASLMTLLCGLPRAPAEAPTKPCLKLPFCLLSISIV